MASQNRLEWLNDDGSHIQLRLGMTYNILTAGVPEFRESQCVSVSVHVCIRQYMMKR